MNQITDQDDTWDPATSTYTYNDHWNSSSASSISEYLEGGSDMPAWNEDDMAPIEQVEESSAPVPYGVPTSNDWRDFSIASTLQDQVSPSSGSSPTPGTFDVSNHIPVSPPYNLNLGIWLRNPLLIVFRG